MAAVSLVDQIDVSVARGVLPILEDEWGLSDTQLGLITSVFVVVEQRGHHPRRLGGRPLPPHPRRRAGRC